MSETANTRYRILETLGRGGFGEVFIAHDSILERKVALKFLAHASKPDDQKRFVREARMAAAIAHPYICKIYDFGELDGKAFIACEYIEGTTLRNYLNDSVPPVVDAMRLAHEILEAMAAAHQGGIVHRDLKPANIMLTKDGHIRVLDFGLAKRSWESGPSEAETITEVTQPGTILGTLTYMSPEQLRAETVLLASDVFACGIVLYETLTGVHPFARATPAATTAAILHESPIPLQRDGVPPRMRDIVHKMLAADLKQRYASCEAVLPEVRSSSSQPGLRPSTTPDDASIAVLPFADLSADGNQTYFCDGLVEELINTLMRIRGLRVMSRTSAFHFRNSDLDIRAIGQQLGIRTILEGGVRRSGTRLRVTAQLIDLTDGCQLWSDRYERQLDDILEIQDDIARAIVKSLRVALLDEDVQDAFAPPRTLLTAQELHWKGRYEWNLRTSGSLQRSIGYFRTAVEEDPQFAQAHAGLADAYVTLATYGEQPPDELMPLARRAAETALRIEDRTGEALNALAGVQALHQWDWQQAESSFRRALEMTWRHSTTHQCYAMQLLCPRKRWRQAHAELKVACDLDPLSTIIQTSVGILLYYEGDFDLVGRQPDFGVAHLFLGHTYAHLGQHQRALESMSAAAAHMPDSPEPVAGLGQAHALAGNRDQAQQQLASLEQLSKQRYVSPVLLAQVQAALGDHESALDNLHRARECRAVDLVWVGVRPVFAQMGAEADFIELLESIGLAD